ncbi:kelch repeat-containing protein [Paenibacillus sp. GbtcB18]|uniref:Kelch repeat-containing protein n=1 Tax=Paenibacillus sp. GbtcB18 TaxID=2824763 RepID=UPI001C300EBB|nr:kelch repeat-containing protein [Paenibacillus sp. GbtcB18]
MKKRYLNFVCLMIIVALFSTQTVSAHVLGDFVSSIEEKNPTDLLQSPSVSSSVYGDVYSQRGLVAASGGTKIVTYQDVFKDELHGHGQSTLPNDSILITGGHESYPTDKIYTYYPLENSLIRNYDHLLQQTFHDHSQTTMPDGRVLITGGESYPSIYNWMTIYDKQNFYRPFSSPKVSLPTGLSRHAYSDMAGSKILFTGGRSFYSVPGGSTNVIYPNSYIYDIQKEEIISAASMPKKLYSHAQSTLPDGKVMVTGGVSEDLKSSHSTYIYNPGTNAWKEAAPLPVPIDSHRQATLADGRVVVIGGETNDVERNTIYFYNPQTDTWKLSSTQLPFSLARFGMSSLKDGRLVLTGGHGSGNGRAVLIITFNKLPVLSVNSTNQTVNPNYGNSVITLSGTVADPNNDPVTISATIAGVTKSTVATVSGQSWYLQWDTQKDPIPQGSYTNIPVTASDGEDEVTAVFNGVVQVDRNQAPYAPSHLAPAGSKASPAITASTQSTLSWRFTDPDSGDAQSAYQVIINNAATNAAVLDTNWISSSLSSYSVPAGILSGGSIYEWKVRTKDSRGMVSDYSGSGYIRLNQIPVLSLTSYTDGEVLSDNILNFSWTYKDEQPQQSYQIMGTQDNWLTTGYNSGVIYSNAGSHTTTPLANGMWSFAIAVNDGLDWSAKAYRNNLKLPNALEPNDTFSTAFPIQYRLTYNSQINPASDKDFFSYKAISSGIDKVGLKVPAGKNYDVHVYDANRNLIAAGIRESGQEENVLYEVSEGKLYYIEIVGVNGDFHSSESYALTVSPIQVRVRTDYKYDNNGNLITKTTTQSD